MELSKYGVPDFYPSDVPRACSRQLPLSHASLIVAVHFPKTLREIKPHLCLNPHYPTFILA